MENFTFTAGGNNLQFVKERSGYEGKYSLPGNEIWEASGDFGKIRFHLYRCGGFDIWYNRYEVKRNFVLVARSDSPLLAFHLQLDHNLTFLSNGLDMTNDKGQYEMIHVPVVEALAKFEADAMCETFHINFQPEFLQFYAGCSPGLMNFLEQVEKKKEIRLLNRVRFLTPAMEDHIRAILNYPYHDEFAERFIEGRVHELLILLVHYLDMMDKLPEPDPVERKKAEEVKKIILSDLSLYESIEVLARKVYTTEAKLQATFRQLYGTTVGKFSREARLKKAYELLGNTGSNRETLLSIALTVGYNDAGNFSTAFKQFFGYPPGHIQKRLKRQ